MLIPDPGAPGDPDSLYRSLDYALGRGFPVVADPLLAPLLFGFADQLQQVLSIIGTPIPSQFMLMAPYLATLFAVAGLAGRVRAPAADGIPYIKS